MECATLTRSQKRRKRFELQKRDVTLGPRTTRETAGSRETFPARTNDNSRELMRQHGHTSSSPKPKP
ncbi:hypothetical protein BGAL_0403g00060 [Botrytis galanthina]|uniref:Uncharacterized protein n=1 Tax=Botrytis galanthina TaxID=278940 RepID=A0A4S8QN07_9HELO|nr:hypothetical protein BGAL_0403g00060 [Botrytis galanthina]